ncbi:hypothetical protein PDG61_30465 [Mycolicibacterium sp. BiH015]|uniref:hypothetical protein n=1 Tax=Mycolicibacterium sp. BiH015 TaxID=3018808 RepID=UPI0022E80E6D|nr:hypothetical protein [Mycolicibacterium sp. BiH015]MDA2895268.1 hypothetical protein [Mycolicibacterium sp. BiH015]
MIEHDADVDDIDEALDYAWEWDMADGDPECDAALYIRRFVELSERTGFSAESRLWEIAWEEELEGLWSVICEVGTSMLSGPVTHAGVEELIRRRAIAAAE